MDEYQQEVLMKLSMVEQQMQNLQNQAKNVEEEIIKLEKLKIGLEELKESKEDDVLARIGDGIFINAKLKSKDLLVDVGKNHFVKKDINGTNEMIATQIKKLKEVRQEIREKIEEVSKEAEKIVSGLE